MRFVSTRGDQTVSLDAALSCQFRQGRIIRPVMADHLIHALVGAERDAEEHTDHEPDGDCQGTNDQSDGP